MTKTIYLFTADKHYCGYVNLVDGMSIAPEIEFADVAPQNTDPGTGTDQVYDPATKTWSVPAASTASTTATANTTTTGGTN